MLQACSQRRHVQEEQQEQQKVELRLELLNLSDQCSEKLREVENESERRGDGSRNRGSNCVL